MQNFKNYTILIVDDDKTANESLKNVFLRLGYSILSAHNGEEAIELLASNRVELAIVDIEMPKMNGIELLRAIKKEPKTSSIAVLVLSAHSDNDIVTQAYEIGAADFVRKPCVIEELIQKVFFWTDYIQQRFDALHNGKILYEYKKAIDNSTIISKTDKNGIITYTNDKFCKISGYSKDELIGKPQSMIRHPDMPKEAFSHLWTTILSGNVWSGVVKNKRKNGSSYVVHSTISPILDENGEIVEFIGVRHDITEIETVKEELQNRLGGTERNLQETLEVTAQYENVIDEANMTIKTTPEGIIIFANEKFCEVSGYLLGELVGNTHKIIEHEDTTKGEIKALWRTLKAAKTYKGVIKNKKKDGSVFWIDTLIKPIFVDGELVEYLQVATDITQIISLQSELEDTQQELVYRMGEIGEQRNEETGQHVKRVAEYSRLLAKKYGLSHEDCELIFAASPMHDIGKVAISDKILLKPGPLDAKEFEIIKTHASIGEKLFANSKRKLLQTAAIIAGQHHEKYNGKGYPKGLIADEIHIFGRIVAITDVFDALGADRVYKKGWSVEQIVELLRRERGEQFDPLLIDIFLTNLGEFVAIKEKYSD